MRVLTWNLFHGRDFPPDPPAGHVDVNRPLLDEFATVLDRLEWDVALLQEAPPRWFGELQRRTRSTGARVLTSRNWWPSLQAPLADWNPDLIKSSEGGSNQMLVRSPDGIAEHRTLTLARWPERRRMQWARPRQRGMRGEPARLDKRSELPRELLPAAAGGGPVLRATTRSSSAATSTSARRTPRTSSRRLRERFELGDPTGPEAIDHLLARGLRVVERPRRLAPAEREVTDLDGRLIRLSDHAPVVAEFVR